MVLGTAAVLMAAPGGAAVTISFSGAANGHTVTGFVVYDETRPAFSTQPYSYGTQAFFKSPGAAYRLSFTTDGYFANSFFNNSVFYATPWNQYGINDSINWQFNSNLQQFYNFTITYTSATVLTSTALPADPPQGPAILYFNPGGPGSVSYTIPVTWVAQAGVVPEPASWALLIAGFGVTGGALRMRGGKRAFA